jgi:hypothetical protein
LLASVFAFAEPLRNKERARHCENAEQELGALLQYCFGMTENRNAPAPNNSLQDDAKPDQKIGFMLAIGVAAVVLTWSWLVA